MLKEIKQNNCILSFTLNGQNRKLYYEIISFIDSKLPLYITLRTKVSKFYNEMGDFETVIFECDNEEDCTIIKEVFNDAIIYIERKYGNERINY